TQLLGGEREANRRLGVRLERGDAGADPRGVVLTPLRELHRVGRAHGPAYVLTKRPDWPNPKTREGGRPPGIGPPGRPPRLRVPYALVGVSWVCVGAHFLAALLWESAPRRPPSGNAARLDESRNGRARCGETPGPSQPVSWVKSEWRLTSTRTSLIGSSTENL